ncbi:MAG: HEAT repeat domain-containing protein [Candidatus Muiribacteriota bacterium]
MSSQGKNLKKLQILLYDGSFSEKEKALHQLIEINTIESHQIIKKALREGDEELKYFIKKKFSKILQKDKEELSSKISKTLKEKNKKINLKNLQKYLSNQDPRKRLRAVEVVSKIGDIRAMPLLLSLAEKEQDDFVKATIAKNLGFFKDKSVIPIISKFLNDPDPRVRANAIEGLELNGGEEIIEPLTPLLRDSNNRVQANAVKALARFEINEVLDILEKMIRSHAIWQRESALYALKELNNPATIPFLVEFIQNENEEELQLRALKALSHFSPGIVKEKFIQLSNNPKISNKSELMNFINKYIGKENIEENFPIRDEQNNMPDGKKITGFKWAVVILLMLSLFVFGINLSINYISKDDNKMEEPDITQKVIEEENQNQNDNLDDSQSNQAFSENIEGKKVDDNENIAEVEKENIQQTDEIDIGQVEEKTLPEPEIEMDFTQEISFSNDSLLSGVLIENNSEQVVENSEPSSDHSKGKITAGNDDDNEDNDNKEDDDGNVSEEESKLDNDEEDVSGEEETSTSNLESMLAEIENLRNQQGDSHEEFVQTSETVEEYLEDEVNLPIEQIEKQQRNRIIVLPAHILRDVNNLSIFSNGLAYSIAHILEPVGTQIEIVNPRHVINRLGQMGISSEELIDNTFARSRLLDDLNSDYLLFVNLREISSSYDELWNKYIIRNTLESVKENNIMNNQFLMARLNPEEIDLQNNFYLDDNTVEEREESALPYYRRGKQYLSAQRYEDAYYNLKMAYVISPDSKKYDFKSSFDRGRQEFLLAMNREKENLLRSIRFSMNLKLFNQEGAEELNFSMNNRARDFEDFFSEIFEKIKGFFKSDGLIYSDRFSINGHTNDFPSIVHLYRGIEFFFNPNTEIDELQLISRRNIRNNNRKILTELSFAVENSTNCSLSYIFRSYINLQDNNQSEALSDLKDAIDIDPGRLSIKYNLATTLERLDRSREAQRIYDEIAEVDDKTIYRSVQADSAFKSGLKLFNDEKYEQVIDRTSHSLEYVYTLSVHFLKTLSLYKISDYVEAEEEARIMFSVYPDDVYVRALYGDILYSLNNNNRALQILKTVISDINKADRSPIFETNIYNLQKGDIFLKIGDLYMRKNSRNLALSYYRQAVSASPYSHTASKARQKIQEIEN